MKNVNQVIKGRWRTGFTILGFLIIEIQTSLCAWAQTSVSSPDGRLMVRVDCQEGKPTYSLLYDHQEFLRPSSLGVRTNLYDLTQDLSITKVSDIESIDEEYSLPNIKASHVKYQANKQCITFSKEHLPLLEVEFQVSNHDIAFRYRINAAADARCCTVEEETTGFTLPEGTTTFLCPQMKAMSGWMHTAPSYETSYIPDDMMGKNGDDEGYTFPCLFHLGDKGWLLVSETGVSSHYCGSRLMGHADGCYSIGYPQAKEWNGIGTVAPGLSLPGYTPWRTITVGNTLKAIVETTIAFDVVQPRYQPSCDYRSRYGKGTWSWIIAGDKSMNYETQKRYIDFSAELGYESVLVDALWDTQVGRERVEELAHYAASRGVALYLWYNSNGYWNDAPQGPRGLMNEAIVRRKEMDWMKRIGIRGIKVDFWGSDKQQTMQLYEELLADANDYGLLVIFHGCTLPRGWERMYPNFASAEAVRASENLNFSQEECNREAFSACLHPFIRNTYAAMDFGGSALNQYYNETNTEGGSRRMTSEVFALATAVLFQSPVQHFALAPNNLTDAPQWAIEFMKEVPTTWDEIKFIDGYPGRYVLLARRHGSRWYIAGINAQKEMLRLKINLPMIPVGTTLQCYSDNPRLEGSHSVAKLQKSQELTIRIPCNGGVVLVSE